MHAVVQVLQRAALVVTLSACHDDRQAHASADAASDAAGGGAAPVPDAEPGAPDAGPTPTETRQLSLSSGHFVEAEFVAGPGDRVHVIMTAPTPDLAWNIHTHEGSTVRTIIEEDDVMVVDYWFDPDAQADWWLMPGNSGQGTLIVDVTMDFHGGATFTEWL